MITPRDSAEQLAGRHADAAAHARAVPAAAPPKKRLDQPAPAVPAPGRERDGADRPRSRRLTRAEPPAPTSVAGARCRGRCDGPSTPTRGPWSTAIGAEAGATRRRRQRRRADDRRREASRREGRRNRSASSRKPHAKVKAAEDAARRTRRAQTQAARQGEEDRRRLEAEKKQAAADKERQEKAVKEQAKREAEDARSSRPSSRTKQSASHAESAVA